MHRCLKPSLGAVPVWTSSRKYFKPDWCLLWIFSPLFQPRDVIRSSAMPARWSDCLQKKIYQVSDLSKAWRALESYRSIDTCITTIAGSKEGLGTDCSIHIASSNVTVHMARYAGPSRHTTQHSKLTIAWRVPSSNLHGGTRR